MREKKHVEYTVVTISRTPGKPALFELCVVVQANRGDLRLAHEDYEVTESELRKMRDAIDGLLGE